MICVNELNNCNKRKILEPLCILMSPFAPHIAEELWHLAGHNDSVTKQSWPIYNDAYTQENTFSYPISFNGKTRFNLDLDINLNNEQIKDIVLNNENTKKWIEGKEIVKIIIVPRKIVNIVVK